MTRARRWELGILAAVAIASGVAALALVRWAPVGLVGRYWSNPGWSGPPTIMESRGAVPSLNDVRQHLPGATTFFSAEWSGYLIVERSGRHEFFLLSDDGSCLDIDGATVVDNGGTHAPRELAGEVDLKAGVHRLRVRFFQEAGEVHFRLAWREPHHAARRLTLLEMAPTESAARRQLRYGWFTRPLAVALPVCWALLLLYVPARLVGWLTWREVVRMLPRPEDRRTLRLVLALGVVLMAWGSWFGLDQSWVSDELGPIPIRIAYRSWFSHGWYDKYPTMPFAVLAIPLSAFDLAEHFAIMPFEGPVSDAALQGLFRLVSLVAGLGTLTVACLCGAELYGGRRGVAAALVLLLTPLFLHYGKTANLEVPSLLWFGWAILGLLRVIKYDRARDYVLLGAAAAAAIATKDQHYANLALLPLAVLIVNARCQPSSSWAGRLARALVDSRVWLGAAAAVGASLVLHNVIFNFSGFVAHIRELASFGSILPIVPATAAGYFELTRRTPGLFALGMGWPWFGLAVLGIVLAAWRPKERWRLWLLFVPLSFHLAFTVVTRSVYDRYLFGGVFVLVLFAGGVLSELLGERRWRKAAAAAATVAIGYSALYSASIDVMMVRDARYEVRRWMFRHVAGGTVVGLLNGVDYLPTFGSRFRAVAVKPAVEDLARVAPVYLVVNARVAESRYQALPAGGPLLRGLKDGTLGYREVFRYRAPMPAWALLQYSSAFEGRKESELTNLDKVNPEMVIYKRAAEVAGNMLE